MFFKLGVLKNFAIFKGKNVRIEVFFLIKLQALLKRDPKHRWFPVNKVKFLRRAFYRTPLVTSSHP